MAKTLSVRTTAIFALVSAAVPMFAHHSWPVKIILVEVLECR